MKASRQKRKPPIEIMNHLELHLCEVDNPLYNRDHYGEKWNPRKSTVQINVRESAVSVLAARGYLDEAQVRAATRFRALWERLGGSGAGALDYSREPVDGGPARDPINERQMEAGRELARCRAILGLRGYALVGKVCGQGHSLMEIGSIRRERDTAADNLRGLLDDLAVMWGYRTDAHRVVRK